MAEAPPESKLTTAERQYYELAVLKKGDVNLVVEQLKQDMEADPALKAQAEQKLKSLKGIDDKRCFVSKITRDLLTRALSR